MVVVEKAQKIDLSDAEKVTRMKLGGSEFDFDARVGDPTCVLLSSLLPRYANLYELDLSKNDISDKGLHYLATRALSSGLCGRRVGVPRGCPQPVGEPDWRRGARKPCDGHEEERVLDENRPE